MLEGPGAPKGQGLDAPPAQPGTPRQASLMDMAGGPENVAMQGVAMIQQGIQMLSAANPQMAAQLSAVLQQAMMPSAGMLMAPPPGIPGGGQPPMM